MKRVAMKVVSLALAVALVGAVAAWAAGGHHGKGSGRALTVIEHATTDATTDTGAAGDTAGDILTFANQVFDRTDARR
jgi:allene oxide cyclase